MRTENTASRRNLVSLAGYSAARHAKRRYGVLPYGRQSEPKADRLFEVRTGAVGRKAEPVSAQIIGDGNFGAGRFFRAYRQRCRCYPSWPGRRMIGSAEEFFPVESGRRIVHDSPLEQTDLPPMIKKKSGATTPRRAVVVQLPRVQGLAPCSLHQGHLAQAPPVPPRSRRHP